MRKKIVAGNWKMNLGLIEAIQLSKDIEAGTHGVNCEVILCPSSVFLIEVKKVIHGSKIKLGAQNCSKHENGALTGEISANQLDSAGIEYVIVGHSERREHFGETNEIVNEKLKLALKYKLKPIFCCGEPLQIRNENLQEKYISQQLEESLFVFAAEEFSKVIIAYEPVWAIGTGKTATPEQAQGVHSFIRSLIEKKYSSEIARQIRILYGGSCNPDNADELFKCPDVDGGLIGTASLNAGDFLSVIHSASHCKGA